MASDRDAQKMRPTPLPMLTMPTMPAATPAVAPVNFSKMGASCEMSEIPAVPLRKSNSQRAHHCQLASALPTVKSFVARCESLIGLNTHPLGHQSAGGFCMKKPAVQVMTKYEMPR